MLPPSFEHEIGADVSLIRVARISEAQQLGRDAAVLVLVAGHDNAAGLGFLAATCELRDARLVLVASDARHQRRVLLRAVRRGAVLLIEQPPSALVSCLGDLLSPPQSALLNAPPPEVATSSLDEATASPHLRWLIVIVARLAGLMRKPAPFSRTSLHANDLLFSFCEQIE
jgi:hypothetical protein